MPEQNPPKQPRGSADAEQRARELMAGIARRTPAPDAELVAALEEIAGLAARSWGGTPEEQADALRQINERALAALAARR